MISGRHPAGRKKTGRLIRIMPGNELKREKTVLRKKVDEAEV